MISAAPAPASSVISLSEVLVDRCANDDGIFVRSGVLPEEPGWVRDLVNRVTDCYNDRVDFEAGWNELWVLFQERRLRRYLDEAVQGFGAEAGDYEEDEDDDEGDEDDDQ